MIYMKTVFAAASALALAGCALQEPYQRPEAAPAAYPTGPAYAADQPGATVSAYDTGWAEFLGDASLRRLVRLALDNNRDLRVAMLRVEQARAQLQLQQAARVPQVDLSVAGSNSKNNSASTDDANRNRGVSYNRSAGLSASWELDFFGRLNALDDVAREQYLATSHARQAAQIVLVAQVSEQYLSMLAFGEQLAVSNDTEAAARESYRIAKLRYDTGTGSELDATLAQGVVQQAQANQAALIRQQAQAKNALVLLLGQQLPDDLAAPVPLRDLALMADIPAGLPSGLAAAPARRAAGRSAAARRKRPHRRGARRLLSAYRLDGHGRHRQLQPGQLVQCRLGRLVVRAAIAAAAVRRRRQPGQSRCGAYRQGHRRRAIPKERAGGVSRSGRRPGGARHV